MTILNPGISRFTFSRHLKKPIIYAALAFGGVVSAAPVLAAESWLACDGTVATTTTKDGKPDTTSAAAHDLYAYNDATKGLFKYSEPRKTLDPVFVTGYDDKAISWSNAGGASAGSTAATWEGRIDRAAMSLKMTRTEHGESMVWTEACKPTSPK